MELTVVPVILFLGVLLFSSPSQPARSKAPPAILMPPGMMISDTAMVPNPNYDFGEVEVTSNDELEFNTIMTYINQVYKKIPQEEATQIASSLVEFGKEQNLDPKFAAAVMARESGFNRLAVSSTGAKGLGQLVNHQAFNVTDPFDIRQNSRGMVGYLKRLLIVWKDNSQKVSLALASYFKGPNAMKKANGQMDLQTQKYVADILTYYQRIKNIRNSMAKGS